NVGVRRILGASAGPEHTLSLGTLGPQLFPGRPRKDVQVPLVGELAICDSNLTQQTLELLFFRWALRRFRARGNFSVRRVVDSADEEAGYASDAACVSSTRGKFVQPTDISLGDALIDLLRKQQRDVDVDAFADQLLEGRDPLRRSWHFDHDVGAIHRFP